MSIDFMSPTSLPASEAVGGEGPQFWATVVDGSHHPRKRTKYVRRACDECRRRKLKAGRDNSPPAQWDRPSRRDRRQSVASAAAAQAFPAIASLSTALSSAVEANNAPDYSWSTRLSQEDQQQGNVPTQDDASSRSLPARRLSTGLRAPGSDLSSTPATEPENHVTDTFEVSLKSNRGLSMQSKLSAAHNELGLELPCNQNPTQRQVPSMTDLGHHNMGQELHLPEPAHLESLLQIFWDQHNAFFPCINRGEFHTAVSQWLSASAYGPGNTVVHVLPAVMPLAANLCMVLAVAEFVDPQRAAKVSDVIVDEPPPGDMWHDKGRALVRRCIPSMDQEIEIVRFHVLEGMYLIYMERLRQASMAIGNAVQLAIRAELHDQSLWSGLSTAKAASRRILFWCLYYLDRRISEKCGQPYLLRNEEIDMAEIVTAGVHDSTLYINGGSESVSFNSALCHYVQHLIDWAHLWTDIWDTMFSVRARKLVGDTSLYAKSIGGRIDRMLANVPKELQWRPEHLKSGLRPVEDERQARLPLLVFTRLLTVQLLLHHNPLARLRATTSSLGYRLTKANEVIQAIILHMETFNTYSQLGQWACAVLVECIYHIVPHIASTANDTDRNTAISALLSIKNLMQSMSSTQGSARRAQRVLKRIFTVVECSDTNLQNTNGTGLQFSRSDLASHSNEVGNPNAVLDTFQSSFAGWDFMSQFDFGSLEASGPDLLFWPSSLETFD